MVTEASLTTIMAVSTVKAAGQPLSYLQRTATCTRVWEITITIKRRPAMGAMSGRAQDPREAIVIQNTPLSFSGIAGGCNEDLAPRFSRKKMRSYHAPSMSYS